MAHSNEEKGTKQKLERENSYHTRTSREPFSEIQDIKESVMGLARDIQDVSTDKAHAAADYARVRMGDVKNLGANTMEKMEKHIQAKPGQSIAIAFATGLLASFLFGRRSS